jgi:hypothetical protein
MTLTLGRMRLGVLLLVGAVTVLAGAQRAQAQARPPFFNNGNGVALFDPIIDVVNSGSQIVVQPTVSADRKYVTIGGRYYNTQLIQLQNFPFFQGQNVVRGPVGGAQGAPALAGGNHAPPSDANAAVAVAVMGPPVKGGVLNQVGMTRLGVP